MMSHVSFVVRLAAIGSVAFALQACEKPCENGKKKVGNACVTTCETDIDCDTLFICNTEKQACEEYLSCGLKQNGCTSGCDDAAKIDAYAWHTGNAAGNDPPVGAKQPNPWGLYDTYGYLTEWTADPWHANYDDAPHDGSLWPRGDPKRVAVRGGSWKDTPDRCTSRFRSPLDRTTRDDAVGLRRQRHLSPRQRRGVEMCHVRERESRIRQRRRHDHQVLEADRLFDRRDAGETRQAGQAGRLQADRESPLAAAVLRRERHQVDVVEQAGDGEPPLSAATFDQHVARGKGQIEPARQRDRAMTHRLDQMGQRHRREVGADVGPRG